ncbi:DNRLRE domain-containing protein [Pseudonocardia bannensis]|uniref:DNRLRE domain-containing protein n=1 Tax=Pseudonocardia bannensis TaxID=630973 RepID=A0A848DEC4_9PSEU|nr:DNRLRE domain-containing protein [Pseudonocardia bannensis]NMH90934.1 DNRLRE domain-containing protein [Pseudonocardia bannensis]
MRRGIVAAALGAVLMVTAAQGAAAAAEPVGAAGPGPLVANRTETSDTVTGPDGVRRVTLYSGPVQVQRGAEWVPVDLTLRTDPDGLVRPAAGIHDLVLGPTGPSVRFAGGGSAALDWPTPLPAPELEGNRAVYTQVRPGYDLVVEATRAGFVASVHRSGPTTAPAPALALRGRAEAVPGAGPASGTPLSGSLAERETAAERVVAAAPPAGATPAPFDTTVQTNVLNTDTSGDPDLRLGSYDGTAVARSYLTWDLAPVTGRPITGAVLRLHQDWSSSCRPAAWEVWSSPVVGPATRWANQPAADRAWATSTETRGNNASCAAGWTEVDVTELVRSWAAAKAANGTMQLRAADETDPLGWKRFGSAEGPNVPQLQVTLG